MLHFKTCSVNHSSLQVHGPPTDFIATTDFRHAELRKASEAENKTELNLIKMLQIRACGRTVAPLGVRKYAFNKSSFGTSLNMKTFPQILFREYSSKL